MAILPIERALVVVLRNSHKAGVRRQGGSDSHPRR
jgi:hypothetical protein